MVKYKESPDPLKKSDRMEHQRKKVKMGTEKELSKQHPGQQVNTERLEKQINFIREMDKEKFIGRQTYLSDGKRKENDVEHAWHLALMTLLLSEYANEKIDVLKTMTMVLFHDVVEIDAGDTYAYDEEGKKTQAEREQKAAERLYGLLPEDQGKKLKVLWEEFEAKNTPESRFARTMDNLQPVILNAATDGKAWKEHGVRLSQFMGRQEDTPKGSEALWEYEWEKLVKPFLENGTIEDDR